MMSTTKKRIRRPKHTLEYIKAQFKKYGYTLLSKSYKHSKQILKVRCKNGHIWAVCWNNFSRGNRCRQCFIESNITGDKALKKIVLLDGHYCISEAAKILRVKEHDLRYHIAQGTLPGPKRKVGNRPKRYYSIDDIEEIDRMIE